MGMIFLIGIMSTFVSSEIYLYNTVIKDTNESTVNYHAFYWFDDTSLRGIGKHKDIPITLVYHTEDLPYDLSVGGYSGTVDWCNFTVTHSHNIYSTAILTEPEFVNTTIYTYNYYFDSGSNSGQITINMRDKDSLVADMICHYTDSASVYVENALFGRFSTYMPSFECEGCDTYSFEELSNQQEQIDEMTQNELSIYEDIQTAVGWNFQIWLILSWVVKIGFILIAVILVFAVAYYFYSFLKNLAGEP